MAVLLIAVAASWYSRAKIANIAARRCLATRDVAGARWWLNVTQRLTSRDAESQFLLARAARREGKLIEATEYLQRAKLLGWPRETIDREEWLMQAQSGQLSFVVPYLPELLTEPRGDLAEICEAFVIGYIKAHDFQSAEQLITVWKSDLPHDPEPHFFLGKIQQEFAKWSDAIESYQKALSLDPTHEQATFALAECLVASKKPNEAMQYYLAAEQISDDKARALCGQARCLRELGRAAEAIALLERILASDPSLPEVSLEWAQLKLEQGEFDDALQPLATLAEMQPNEWDIQFAYATALRGTGNVEAAKKLFDKASHGRSQLRRAVNLADHLKQDDVEARYQIGLLHLTYGEPTEGLWWLNSVLNYDPRHASTHQALATYYAKKSSQDSQFASLAEQHRRLAGSQAVQPEASAANAN